MPSAVASQHRIGLAPHQPDPGWWLILALKRLGLVWNIVTPEAMARREELERLMEKPQGCPFCGAIRRQLGLPAW